MSLGKAIQFVKHVGGDQELRNFCIKSPTKKELLEELGFNETEFEDALNMQLVKCQTFEEAQEYYQIRLWFSLL